MKKDKTNSRSIFMDAVIYAEYGPPSVLQFKEIEKPVPQKNEVLVKVYASTVTAGTIWLRRGEYTGSVLFTVFLRLMYGLFKPRKAVLGFEFSGEVEDVGKEVKLFKKGDHVYGTTTGLQYGAYAEYICVPENRKEGIIALKPLQLNFNQAAALPIGGMAALHFLLKLKFTAGQHILIYGASGSVGTYAVQIAKYFGCIVTAACGAANILLVKSIGADNVIDYVEPDISGFKKNIDAVFDAVGKMPSSLRRAVLKQGGSYCSVKSNSIESSEYLHFLHRMIKEGKLTPVIDRVYPLTDIVKAHEYVDLGHKKGNVVIGIVKRD